MIWHLPLFLFPRNSFLRSIFDQGLLPYSQSLSSLPSHSCVRLGSATAPCSISIVMHVRIRAYDRASRRAFRRALNPVCRTLRPFPVLAERLAPSPSSHFVVSIRPRSTALCNAVSSRRSRLQILAP